MLADGGLSTTELSRHGALESERFELARGEAGHFGGDQGLLDHFTEIVARDDASESQTSGRIALASHLLGFAAERSRLAGKVVELD